MRSYMVSSLSERSLHYSCKTFEGDEYEYGKDATLVDGRVVGDCGS